MLGQVIFSDGVLGMFLRKIIKKSIAAKSVLKLSVLSVMHKKEPDPNLEYTPKQVWLSRTWSMVT